jgi:tetratricopeptide (TPR) repeat protein
LFERGLYNTALTIFESAEDICKRHEQDQSITLANLYSTYGTIYRNCNNPAKGRELFELAIERREAAVAMGSMGTSNIRLADAYMHLGSALLSLNDIPKSLEYHLRAINIREQHRHCEPQILALSYINIGWVYWQDNQLDKASEVLEKSLHIMEGLQENEAGQSGQ